MTHRKTVWESCVLILCLGAGYVLWREHVSYQPRKADAGAVPARRPAVSYAQLPLSFEANQGQTDQSVKFLSRGRGYGLFLAGEEVVLELQESGVGSQESEGRTKRSRAMSALQRTKDNGPRTPVLRLKLLNADPNATITGARELPGKVNYFLGNDPKKWRTNVPTYGEVRYRSVYPGIDLVYYGNQGGQLEYDFVVAPGADPRSILLAVDATAQVGSKQKPVGSGRPKIASNGDLVVRADGDHEVRFRKPFVYQPDTGSSLANRRSSLTQGRFILDAQNRVHFALGPYDHTRPLVIDPVLVYTTYLGGSGWDQGFGIAVDSSGNIYVTGCAQSTNFPTASPLQARLAGGQNVFVAKLNPTGSALVYSTYLGGTGADQSFGIAVDSSGNAYVTGGTKSANFPTTPGAFQTSLRSAFNAFVAKLNPTGSALVYSTFLGGSGGEYGFGIAVDTSGDAYVTGSTASTNFPTANPIQASLAGDENAFVAELNPKGSVLVYSTYLGGTSIDIGYGIGVDSSGNAYVAGSTSSSDFPTANPIQASLAGTSNAFVAKLNWSGSALTLAYSTYLGGGEDVGNAIAVDSSGRAHVAGYTDSPSFPTASPLQESLAGSQNAFVAELNPTGSALVYSTYLGGSGHDMGLGIAVDSSGNAYVIGSTTSINFPTANPLQASLAGPTNAFVAKLSWNGSALSLGYSTYLGGSYQDSGWGIAVDSSGNAYVIGCAGSTNFPTVAPFQAASEGGAFVAKIGAADSPGIAFGPGALTFPNQILETPSPSQSVTLTAAGSKPLNLTGSTVSGDFALATTDTSCPYSGGTVAAGGTCTIDVTFTPTATGTRSGSVTISDDASSSPQSFSLTGRGVATGPVADVSPGSLTFGSQLVGTTSAAQPVTLSNTGNAALTVTSISVIGDFGQTNNCSVSVAAGSSCTINVTFTPQSVMLPPTPPTLSGALTITDNSRNTPGSTQTVSLSGTLQDFMLITPTGYSSSATVSPGQTAKYTLSVVGEGGFDQLVALSCGGVPTESTCAVSPNPVVPGSNFSLLVTTTAQSAIAPRTLPPPLLPRPQALLALAVLLACIAWTVRAARQAGARRWAMLLPLAAGLLLALGLAGCGGGSSSIRGNYGTSPGAYTLTVTGTAGSGSATLSHSVTVILNVS